MAAGLLIVEFSGTVTSNTRMRDGTSRVEEDGSGYVHYLYLGSGSAREEVLSNAGDFDETPERGASLRVKFTARPDDGPPVSELNGATQVSSGSFTHYVFTGSPSVQELGEDRDGNGLYSEGDTVKVALRGQVLAVNELSSTCLVREENGKEHLIYMAAGRVRTDGRSGTPDLGATVEVSFEATVRGAGGEVRAGGRRRVKGAAGTGGYYHYLDMSSPSVQLAAGSLARRLARERTIIGGLDLLAEIEALEAVTWAARRVRDAEVLEKGFDDAGAAEAWIAENDYLPGTVEACVIADGEPPPQLAALRELDELADAVIDGWHDGAFVIPADKVDANYAKQEFLEETGMSVDLDESPYRFIDWYAAASDIKENRPSFSWGGRLWIED